MSAGQSGRTTAARRELSDAQILSRVAQGEQGLLVLIYDRHHDSLARFVARASCQTTDLEDILQEVFLLAAQKAGTFRGEGSCRAWLTGIAAHEVLHRKRAWSRLRRFLERAQRVEPPAVTTPHEHLDQRDTTHAVRQALARLSDAKRVVLVMNELEEMSCEQIAASLQIPVGTVWTRLHHARRELRALLDRRPG